MPLDPYFTSRQRETRAYAPAPDESEAMQIGRDDYKAAVERFPNILPAIQRTLPIIACPFPQGSEDAAQWQEGWERERDGK